MLHKNYNFGFICSKTENRFFVCFLFTLDLCVCVCWDNKLFFSSYFSCYQKGYNTRHNEMNEN